MQSNEQWTRLACRIDFRWGAILALSIVGCGGRSDGRVDISGPVTWKGEPVPAGFVVFNPNVAEGNIGPQGMAPIVNGRYDTRSKGGRPVNPGSLLVSVHGFNGKKSVEDRPNGTRLFMPADFTVVAPAESGEVELVVPDSVEALR